MGQGYKVYDEVGSPKLKKKPQKDTVSIRNNRILSWILNTYTIMFFVIYGAIAFRYTDRLIRVQGTLLLAKYDMKTYLVPFIFLALMIIMNMPFAISKTGSCSRPLTKRGRKIATNIATIFFIAFLVVEAYFILFQSYITSFDDTNIYINNKSIKTVMAISDIDEADIYNVKKYHSSKYSKFDYLGVEADVKYQGTSYVVADLDEDTSYERIKSLVDNLIRGGFQKEYARVGNELPAQTDGTKKIFFKETPAALLSEVKHNSETVFAYDFVNKQKDLYEATIKAASDLKDSADMKVFKQGEFTIAFVRSSKDTFPIIYYQGEPYYMSSAAVIDNEDIEFVGNGKKIFVKSVVYSLLKQEAIRYFNVK